MIINKAVNPIYIIVINRLIDQPLSLNNISLNLLFKSHLTKPSTFVRADINKIDDTELFKFIKNYFEYGLPIFSEDLLDEEYNQVTYKANPLSWVSKFDDSQVELILSYIYLRKYMEHYFMSHWLKNIEVEQLVQKLMDDYGNKSIIKIKTEVHESILKLEAEFKEEMPDIKFDYSYQKYLETGDLNILFHLCYYLFFNGVPLSPEENLYNKQKISNLIE